MDFSDPAALDRLFAEHRPRLLAFVRQRLDPARLFLPFDDGAGRAIPVC